MFWQSRKYDILMMEHMSLMHKILRTGHKVDTNKIKKVYFCVQYVQLGNEYSENAFIHAVPTNVVQFTIQKPN